MVAIFIRKLHLGLVADVFVLGELHPNYEDNSNPKGHTCVFSFFFLIQ